ncbi:MAG: Uncharacterized protein FD133_251 [Erysipelotrichaceae bacterium]|nr:MAG: Uncharacterized protein FD133_251 [Erysipelotrichaceae bacterium]
MSTTNKTVILEKQTRQSILMGLLEEKPFIEDTSFISFNVFLNSFIRYESDQDWFKCITILEKEAHKFPTLEKILKFPITSDHLLSFMNTMADEGWGIDDLPEESLKDKELKEIITLLLPQFNRRECQWQAANQQASYENVQIYDHFYTYSVYKRILKFTEKGLQLTTLPKQKPKIKAFYANNPRSEAQACIQYILESKLAYDQQVIVCLDSNLQNQVASFLIQYDIPYFRPNEYRTNASFRLMQDLIQLKFNHTKKNVLKLLQNDKLILPYRLDLITYIETFGIDLKTCLQPLNHVQQALVDSTLDKVIRIEDYKALERRAELGLSNLRPKMQILADLDTNNFETFTTGIFDLYVSFFTEFSDEDVESINKVKSTIEAGYPYLKDMNDPYLALIYKLSLLTLSNKQSTGIILTDLENAFTFGKKRIFLLSCTQDFYPQLPTQNGLFDDDYLRAISPDDQQPRFDYHMQQLEKLRFSVNEIIYSYPIGSYEGKVKKLPFELEMYFKENEIEASAWNLIEIERSRKRERAVIDNETAQALYFKDNEIQGSISTFEKYYRCPYQYYLAAGMKLYEPTRYGIDNAMMGTLLHLVLENGIINHNRSYADVLLGNEEGLLKPYFDDLKRLFKAQDNELEIMHRRTAGLLNLSLTFLSGREHSSVFNQYETEKHFNTVLDVGSDKKLHIKGIIDRIDFNSTGFLIIDYKSSTKSLSESQVMEGVQLQLLTYLWIGDKVLNLKTPYGAYYFSLGQTNTKLAALKMSKRPLSVVPASNAETEWLRHRKLKGWPFMKLDTFDNPGGYFVKPQSRAVYDIKKVEKHLQEKYKKLIEELEQGNIKKQNMVNSCLYCAYKHFCQHDQEPIKLERIYPRDSKLLEGNGEDNDNQVE